MADRKATTPATFARDDRLERACRAYLLTGATTRAAKATGISQPVVHRLVNSADGQALLERLRREAGSDLAKQCLAAAERFLGAITADLDDPAKAAQISTRDKAVIFGILADKARVLDAGPAADTGVWQVSVKWGGARVDDGVPTTTAQVAAAQVTVTSRPPSR